MYATEFKPYKAKYGTFENETSLKKVKNETADHAHLNGRHPTYSVLSYPDMLTSCPNRPRVVCILTVLSDQMCVC